MNNLNNNNFFKKKLSTTRTYKKIYNFIEPKMNKSKQIDNNRMQNKQIYWKKLFTEQKNKK